jgi:hypothetical protein
MIVFQQIAELGAFPLIQNLWMRQAVGADWLVESGQD